MPASASPWGLHPHPEVWVLIAALGAGYWLAVRRLGPRRVPLGEAPATRRQAGLFAAGLSVLWIGADWPVHDLAEGYLYSVHMVQHLLFTLVAVPLLYLGIPGWMLRALLPPPLMRLMRFATRPLIALVLFNGVLVFTHWPTIVTASVRSEAAHFGLHVLIVASAIVMWTPVLSPILELPRLSYPKRMLYLFAQSIVPTVPASFLTFGDRPLYHVYETFPRVLGISALTDQLVAGLIMKIVGGLILWVIIAVLFFRWYEEEHASGIDALEWQDVDGELNRLRLRNP